MKIFPEELKYITSFIEKCIKYKKYKKIAEILIYYKLDLNDLSDILRGNLLNMLSDTIIKSNIKDKVTQYMILIQESK